MSGWLPPGCTDKDIDDAAPQNEPEPEEETFECISCGKTKPISDLASEQYTIWGAVDLICDYCIESGDWPPQREHEPE